jgi:hypothetical protein
MKIGIIGTGHVGCACAIAAAIRGSASEIVLVNRTRKTAEAVATDLRYGIPVGRKVEVTDGDYGDLAGAGVVLITSGVNEKTGGATDRSDPQGRLKLLNENLPPDHPRYREGRPGCSPRRGYRSAGSARRRRAPNLARLCRPEHGDIHRQSAFSRSSRQGIWGRSQMWMPRSLVITARPRYFYGRRRAWAACQFRLCSNLAANGSMSCGKGWSGMCATPTSRSLKDTMQASTASASCRRVLPRWC